jgi:hypothetical protein
MLYAWPPASRETAEADADGRCSTAVTASDAATGQGLPVPKGVATKPKGTAQQGFGTTLRVDRWSIAPALVGIGFTIFILYSLVSSILLLPVFGFPYEADGYLSPFFSPLIVLPFLPEWISPAFFILWIPLAFRTTCYYYRKAYYRAFFFDPPACAVGEPSIHRRFRLETAFPFILQNLHRYFLYLAFIPLAFLWIDTIVSVRHDDAWRIGLGTFVLGINAGLLMLYTLSCHSLRHLVGGRLDCFSCTARVRTGHRLWSRATLLNLRHHVWAWASLISVVVADVYVRLLGLGIITDPAITF